MCDEIIPLHETSKSTVHYTNMHHNDSERDIESLKVEVRFMTVKIAEKCLTRVDNEDIIKRFYFATTNASCAAFRHIPCYAHHLSD